MFDRQAQPCEMFIIFWDMVFYTQHACVLGPSFCIEKNYASLKA